MVWKCFYSVCVLILSMAWVSSWLGLYLLNWQLKLGRIPQSSQVLFNLNPQKTNMNTQSERDMMIDWNTK